MESFFRMLDAQAVLLVYLCIGFYCAKKDIIDGHTKQKLTDLILQITLPCMIFESFDRPLTPELLKQTFAVLMVALMIAILSYLCGKVLYNRYPWEKKSVLQYATLVNNCGFLGLPMVSAVYGSEGLLFASIFIIPNRIFMWTAGISIFTKADLKSNLKNILLNPCIITVILGLGRRILNIPVHEVIDTAVSAIGQVTTPLSMFVIGTMGVGVSIPSLF